MSYNNSSFIPLKWYNSFENIYSKRVPLLVQSPPPPPALQNPHFAHCVTAVRETLRVTEVSPGLGQSYPTLFGLLELYKLKQVGAQMFVILRHMSPLLSRHVSENVPTQFGLVGARARYHRVFVPDPLSTAQMWCQYTSDIYTPKARDWARQTHSFPERNVNFLE